MFCHPSTTNAFIGFFHRRRVLRESVQQYRSSVLVEKVQNPIPGFSHAKSDFTKFSLNLRGIGVIESWSALFEQINSGDHLASNFLRQAVKPCLYGESAVILFVKVDLPKF